MGNEATKFHNYCPLDPHPGKKSRYSVRFNIFKVSLFLADARKSETLKMRTQLVLNQAMKS